MIVDKISIITMKKIFQNDATEKCSVSAKMVYQSVLTHYFSDKITNIHLLLGFHLDKEYLKYSKFSKEFNELHKAELIKILPDQILFHDVWTKYISVSEFGTAPYTRITANDIKEELYQSHGLNELIRMKYRVTIKKANDMLQLFLKEQEAIKTKYNDEAQVRKHFVYWCQGHLNSNPGASNNNPKILGKK